MTDQIKRRITIKDIAQIAHTSKTTVSFYLNGHTERMSEDTQARIAQAIERTGYEPNPLARSMNGKNTHLIGVVIGDVTNTFSNRIVKGIGAAAREEGYRLLICESNYQTEDEASYIDRLLSLGIDGFIVQPTAQFRDIAGQISAAGKKLVFFDSKFYNYASNWVKTTNYESTYEAITTCIQKGYRQFLLVGAATQMLSSRIERSLGFTDALERHHLTYHSYELPEHDLDTQDLAQFFDQHLEGANEQSPTLIFVPNCWALPDVYVALKKYYPRMPKSVGLVGFDNFDWSHVASPSVTTIEQPAFLEGKTACEALLKLTSSEEVDCIHEVLPCNICWRETTR